MKDLHSTHQASKDWIKTIEEGKGYATLHPSEFRQLLRRMQTYELFNVLMRYTKPGQRVLEAGCGWATSSFALAKLNRHMTAMDISSALIHELQTLQIQLGAQYATHLTFIADDIFRLSEHNQTFDMVFSDGTYEHFLHSHDRRNFLANIHSVLPTGKLMLVAVPNLHNPFFRSVVDQKMPSMQAFTLQSLGAEIEQSGFSLVESGFSFVNPGFTQWVKSYWMTVPIHAMNVLFPFLPRIGKRLMAAHLYVVARAI